MHLTKVENCKLKYHNTHFTMHQQQEHSTKTKLQIKTFSFQKSPKETNKNQPQKKAITITN